MVHGLAGYFPSHSRITLWDVGAIFDPYCGVFMRNHYRLPDWQENVMEKNLR